jgi:hypothetical protein
MRRALLAILLAATVVSGPAAAQESAWSSRGPAGAVWPDFREHITAGVAPTWPADRALFAVADGWLVRSDDEGASWRYLPARFDKARFIWPAPGVDRTGVVLALRGDSLLRISAPLLRSGDGGASWQEVLSVVSSLRMIGNVQLTYSPTFAADGIAFLVCGGKLFRTTDAGQTWAEIDLSPVGTGLEALGVLPDQQLAQQVQLSPSFGQDQTVFLTLGSATYFPFPSAASLIALSYGDSPVVPSVHYQTSVGVAVSHDGGLSWQPASSGLEVDGEPHRFVRNLVVSPTFETDRTLFAWAWGRPEPTEVAGLQRLGFANALFRSQDGGASWQVVWDRPQAVTDLAFGHTQGLGIALSPSFATDGLLLVTTLPFVKDGDNVWMGETRQRGPCELRRSRDCGESWETVDTPAVAATNRPTACGEPRFVGPNPAHFILGGGPLGGRIVETRDGGATWVQPNRPPGMSGWAPILGVAADGTILVKSRDRSGIWTYGGPPRPGRTPPSCPVVLDVPRFGEAAMSRLFMCAWAPAAAVRIRERQVGTARGVWVDDDSPDWWLLRKGNGYAAVDRHDKGSEPWSGPPTRVVDGYVQRGWSGVTLVLMPSSDGRRQTHVIRENDWESFDAGP